MYMASNCNSFDFSSPAVNISSAMGCTPLGTDFLLVKPTVEGSEILQREMAPGQGRYYEVQASSYSQQFGSYAVALFIGVIGPNGPVDTLCHKDNDSENYEYYECKQGKSDSTDDRLNVINHP